MYCTNTSVKQKIFINGKKVGASKKINLKIFRLHSHFTVRHAELNMNLKFCFIFLVVQVACNQEHVLKKYLQRRYNLVEKELKDSHCVRFDADKERRVVLQGNYESVHSFIMYNTSYLLLDNVVLRITPGREDKVHKSRSKFNERIAFIKTVDHDDLGLMIVAFENGVSTVYGYTNTTTDFFYIQSIQNAKRLNDAKFFFSSGELYLITTIPGSLAPITLYKWVSTYFDEIDKIILDHVVGVDVFQNYIIFLRKSYTYIYEFHSDKLWKTQILNTINPQNSITVDNYVAIFNHAQNNLYWWDGNELVSVQNFNLTGIEMSATFTLNETTFILAATKSQIFVYVLSYDSLHEAATIKLTESYKEVLKLSVVNNGQVYILGLLQNLQVSYSTIAFTIQKSATIEPKIETNELIECMDKLETIIEDAENTIGPVLAQTSQVDSVYITSEFEREVLTLTNEISNLEHKIESLLPLINNLTDENTTVINGKLIIQGGINTERIDSKRMHVKVLNNVIWNPETWWLYSKNQEISGKASIKNLHVQELTSNIFDDALLLKGNQQLSGNVHIDSLKAKNIYVTSINNISIDDIYLKSQPSKISGEKYFDKVSADSITLDLLNKQNASDIIKLFGDKKAIKFEFAPHVVIENLNVEQINNVDWNQFTNNVFKIGSKQNITGNIIIKQAKMDKLFTKTISGINVNHLLTTSTNQSINSTITFSVVDADNVMCNKINDLDIENDVATFDDDQKTIIKGPVTIKNINVSGSLSMNKSISDVLEEHHVVGLNESDLLQIYKQPVTISGNLYLENVYLPDPAKLIINEIPFYQNDIDNYWLKSKKQDIPVAIELLKGATIPHLNTRLLNNVPVSDYMVNNLDDKLPTTYHFKNITVLGNIFVNDKYKHQPDLEKLQRESVKLNGSYVIGGYKKFKGVLTVNNLKTDLINATPTSNLVTKYTTENLGNKTFETLIVEGTSKINQFTTININGRNLEEIKQETIYTNSSPYFETMNFANISAGNLTTKKVNNKLLSEYILSLDEIYLKDSLNLVLINGNATVGNINVKYINDIDMEDKIKNINKPIKSDVRFQGKVDAENLFINDLNGIKFRRLLNKLYYRHWVQNITAMHTFKTITTPNLVTPLINDVNIDNLIDIKSEKPQLLVLKNGLRLAKPKFRKSLKADQLQCDFDQAIRSLHNIPNRSWKEIHILNNTEIIDPDSPLYNIVMNTVKKNEDTTINAAVNFKHVYAENITSVRNINKIDLQAIIDDALLINEPGQVVTGHKTFGTLRASSAKVKGATTIPIINNFNIVELNESIINKNDINNVLIKGRKSFLGGVQATNFNAPVVSGVVPENLVCLKNPRQIPSAYFETVKAENLNVEFVNQRNFTEFLKDRLLLKSFEDQEVTGIYYFDELELDGNTVIPKINDVNMEDVVFDEGHQVITAPKKFIQNTEFSGDVIIEKINGFNIGDLFDQAVMINDSPNFKENVYLNEISEVSGDIIAENINGLPVEFIKDQLNTENPQIRADIVHDTIKNIKSLVEENLALIHDLPEQYLYLEKSDELQVEIPNGVDAQIIESVDGVFVHAALQESGVTCGLPENCFCPNQNTFKITPKYNINYLANKQFQRVFSYQNHELTIHIVTNTKSSSFNCRTNTTILQEFTTINLVSTLDGETYFFPQQILGYLSDVKFFTYDRDIYAVLNIFYDPLLNTHDVNAQIIKFSMNKAEIVQQLPVKGGWTTHVYYTAQGVNLVIGNKESSVDIYKFNPGSKMFDLLRRIPSNGCLSITSIVYGYNSMLLVTNLKSPLEIYKYNSQYNNYYFYENIIFEYPVISLSTFYTGGMSDAYLTVVTENNRLYIYEFKHLSGWKLQTESEILGLKSLVPFKLNNLQYLLAFSSNGSSLLTIIKQGLK